MVFVIMMFYRKISWYLEYDLIVYVGLFRERKWVDYEGYKCCVYDSYIFYSELVICYFEFISVLRVCLLCVYFWNINVFLVCG